MRTQLSLHVYQHTEKCQNVFVNYQVWQHSKQYTMVEQLKNKCTSFLICDVRNDRWSVAYSIVDSAHTGSQFNFLSTIQWKLSQTNNMRLERVSFTIFAIYGHLHVANTVINELALNPVGWQSQSSTIYWNGS